MTEKLVALTYKHWQNKKDDVLKIKNIETDSQICNSYKKKLRYEKLWNIKKQSMHRIKSNN